MIFETKNGAKYEVEGSRVRMINREAKDRDWRNFKTMTAVEPGHRVAFLWRMNMPDDNSVAFDTSTTDVVTGIASGLGN